MGCDIHTYREKHVNGKWLTADEWETYEDDGKSYSSVPYESCAYTGRNYNLFGLLAGVRREFPFSLEPRGVAFDACEEVRSQADKWGVDGHSHSYLYLHELKSLREWVASQSMPIKGMMAAKQKEALEASLASDTPDYNLLYPYCAWSTDESYAEFSIDFPMSFIVGKCLDKLIASFDGIEGDNHRLSFFFDN